MTVSLNAKGKPPTPVDSLLGFAFRDNDSSAIESGVETVVTLMDKRRREEWKKDLGSQFPLVPTFVIDASIDSLADSFASIAPSQLKAALRPGGFEKVQDELEETIVKALEEQPLMKNIPVKQDDKRQLLQYLVGIALGHLLKDVQELLKEPGKRLQTLEAEKRQIQKYMSFWRLTWYRFRHFPLQMLGLCCSTTYISYTLYQRFRHTVAIVAVEAVLAKALSRLKETAIPALGSLLVLGKQTILKVMKR